MGAQADGRRITRGDAREQFQLMAMTIGIGFLLLAAVVPPRANAASPKSACTARMQRVTMKSVASSFRCAVREKRKGTPAPGCRSRADSVMSKGAQDWARCGEDIATARAAVDRCLAGVLANISDTGRCAARKMKAALKSLSQPAGGQDALCRAFARAGTCAGDCIAVATALNQCPRAVTAAGSTFPAVGSDDQVVLFGAYEGDAISSTTIAGQDEVTETARVLIEPGDAPLYVILTSYAHMIWRFEGDVSRVRQLVLLGSSARGVTGIAAEQIVDLTGTSDTLSQYFDSTDSPESRRLRNAVESALGRRVDVMAASYTVGTVSLPSAAVEVTGFEPPTIPPEFDAFTYASYGLWYHRGGVIDIDPALVISASPAAPYEVLPAGFGLAQLVATGALEARDGYFYIARSMPRFPAGLYGAESVVFVLGTGVPMPAGSPGHSCVISEETGQPIGDLPICPFLPPTVSCDMPEPQDADQIVVFGAYEADAISTTATAGQDEVTETARVVIEPGDGPLYIALVSYESIIWRFEGDISRIDRLVLMGYGAQGVMGVPAARITDSSGSGGCATYFYDVQSPEGVATRGTLEQALGRAVDSIAGSYTVGTLSLPSATVTATETPSTVPPGFDPVVYERRGLWFNPGGVIDVDPSQVISAGLAERYEVLPEGFGLAQLVATGALEDRGGSDFFGGYFYIAQPIPRFPAGLYGAELASFVLGRGVPLPAGSPGHSCVISEDTGLPVVNDFICAAVTNR